MNGGVMASQRGGIDATTDPNTGEVAFLSAGGQKFPLPIEWKQYASTEFTKAPDPVFSSLVGTYPGMFSFSVVRVDHIPGALGKYYAYYSSEHDAGDGGIAMAYANDPLGPWTDYGQVFVDTTRSTSGNTQTEGAAVIADPDGSLRMYYQIIAATVGGVNAQGVQSTLSATSADGLTWAFDDDFIIDVPKYSRATGNGHTGYFQPFMLDGRWFAYSLMGSGDYPGDAIHYCNGPLDDWTTDPRMLGYHIPKCDMGDAVERHVGWAAGVAVRKNGAPYLIVPLGDFVSGGAASNKYIAIARLSDDLRTPVENFKSIWTPTEAWESRNIYGMTPYVEGNTLYLYYITKVSTTYSVGVISHVL